MYKRPDWTGSEALMLNGNPLPYTMLDYWKLNLSDILLNMNRGGFAEFIVQSALTYRGANALSQEKNGTEPWDIDGPMIITPDGKRCSRIEVKSAASVQIDTPDEKEPISLPDTQITFSIRKAIDWSAGDEIPRHNNELYVFCHYTATRKNDNMLDLSFWDFYVMSTARIEADPSLSQQKTISLYRLKKLGIPRVGFSDLYDTILSELKAYYTLA